MKYNSITTLIKGREFVIRSNCCDIETLKPEDIIFLDHDEEYDENNCKCQISFLDGKPPLSYDDIKLKYNELMDAEPMRLLRIERNKRLEKTDYKFKQDYKHKSNTHKKQWEQYRQYLRDLPHTAIPEINDKGDLSFNFMDEPNDENIKPNSKDDPIPLTNEDIINENMKLKDDLKKIKKTLSFITEQMGILRYADSE
jgi:hypothetical protein